MARNHHLFMHSVNIYKVPNISLGLFYDLGLELFVLQRESSSHRVHILVGGYTQHTNKTINIACCYCCCKVVSDSLRPYRL